MMEIIYGQLAYAAAGALFNLASWWRVRRGFKPLTATSPAKGMVSMLTVALITLSFPLAAGWIYRVGWVLLILRIAPGGIVRHLKTLLIDRDLTHYASFRSGITAAGINIIGVTLGILGLIASLPALGASAG